MSEKIALVTGSYRGLGLAVVEVLAKLGIRTILTSRDEASGKAAAHRLRGKGLPVEYCQLDVNDDKSVKSAAAWVETSFGKLDILVNNAGIAPEVGRDEWGDKKIHSLFTAELALVRQTLETNTLGPIRMIQACTPLMRKSGYGRIVNVSSGMGQLEDMNGGWPGYRVSKVGLNAVTRIAADELQGTDILVNSVCPGWVKTAMGGPGAELSVEEGADTIVWLATLPTGGPTGGFFRERKQIGW